MSEPLEALHQAVQDFSNALSESAEDVGFVNQAIVVWEEVSFDDEGRAQRRTLYAASGDGVTPAATIGLAVVGLAKIERDVLGCRCDGS